MVGSIVFTKKYAPYAWVCEKSQSYQSAIQWLCAAGPRSGSKPLGSHVHVEKLLVHANSESPGPWNSRIPLWVRKWHKRGLRCRYL